MMYDKIKKWFSQGLWTSDMVLTAAEKGMLTQQQAGDILEEARK